METKLKLLLEDDMSDPSKIFSAISVIKGITLMKFEADQRRLIVQGEMDLLEVMQKLKKKKWNYKLIWFGFAGRRSPRQPQQQFQSPSPPPTPAAPLLLMPADYYAYPYPYPPPTPTAPPLLMPADYYAYPYPYPSP